MLDSDVHVFLMEEGREKGNGPECVEYSRACAGSRQSINYSQSHTMHVLSLEELASSQSLGAGHTGQTGSPIPSLNQGSLKSQLHRPGPDTQSPATQLCALGDTQSTETNFLLYS